MAIRALDLLNDCCAGRSPHASDDLDALLSQSDTLTAGLRGTNTISDQNGPVCTEQYGYDAINRLTAVNYGDGHTQRYTFDPMGNRQSKQDDNLTPEGYTYNNANMLLTRGANNYTNDPNGNTLTGGGRTNVWDSQNRLASCTVNGATSTFTYSADGLRHKMVTGASITHYAYDATMPVRELDALDAVAAIAGLRFGPAVI